MKLTSDHSWLCPFFAELRKRPAFHHLSPSHQFAELCTEVEREHAKQAAWLRTLNPTDQDGLLRYLAMTVDRAAPSEAAALWRVRKSDRELRCIVHHPADGARRAPDGAGRFPAGPNSARLHLKRTRYLITGESRCCA